MNKKVISFAQITQITQIIQEAFTNNPIYNLRYLQNQREIKKMLPFSRRSRR